VVGCGVHFPMSVVPKQAAAYLIWGKDRRLLRHVCDTTRHIKTILNCPPPLLPLLVRPGRRTPAQHTYTPARTADCRTSPRSAASWRARSFAAALAAASSWCVALNMVLWCVAATSACLCLFPRGLCLLCLSSSLQLVLDLLAPGLLCLGKGSL
jgi:hypothetical protein